jgi:Icc-related predicted phosphoesterase
MRIALKDEGRSKVGGSNPSPRTYFTAKEKSIMAKAKKMAKKTSKKATKIAKC